MCVFSFDVFIDCSLVKKHLKSKKIQGIFGETFTLALSPSVAFHLKFLLICFAQEIKAFYRSSVGNEVDFTDIINISPNILAKN